jgi:hypothetical protein
MLMQRLAARQASAAANLGEQIFESGGIRGCMQYDLDAGGVLRAADAGNRMRIGKLHVVFHKDLRFQGQR